MKLKKIIKHKKHLVLGLLLSTLLLTGCVKTTNDPLEVPAKMPNVKQENKLETEETQLTVGEGEHQSELTEKGTVPVNFKREEVWYPCDDGINLTRAVHRSASDGENLYLAYTEKDLYVLAAGDTQHKPMELENPERLEVCHVTVDTEGRLHLLMASSNFSEWYIWQLDDSFGLEKQIEVTAHFDTERIPSWFMVDKDGHYYLQWPIDRNGVIVSEDGALLHRTTCASLGVSWIYEAAVGNDGNVYLVYSQKSTGKEIGILDTKQGSLRPDGVVLNIPDSDTFSFMAAGTDTEILMYGPYCGVWAYDSEKRIFNQRIKPETIGYGADMDFWPLGFQADGRLVTVGSPLESKKKVTELLLKYIPAGR